MEQCFIFGFTQNGIEVAVGASADVYITNTYITKVDKGVLANATAGFVIVSINNTNILNVNTSGFEAKGGIDATIENSNITSTNNGVNVTGASQVNVESSTFLNNFVAFNASVSGAIIRVANNAIYNNVTNFTIAAGGSIASTGNNRITPGGATAPNATITQQ